ncbi:hypothetical protein FPANT_13022 [Fusarium pseudoanthophilum]|uniref:Uncharacterized protein n=1 Tax=Fusarium pseudoanthophilum TaxID=48495 RepID=A0A8H5KFW3_9HYPO|nr:hypothetical protein FPANT_13022 [Fusarium pseudoanthophilum]
MPLRDPVISSGLRDTGEPPSLDEAQPPSSTIRRAVPSPHYTRRRSRFVIAIPSYPLASRCIISLGCPPRRRDGSQTQSRSLTAISYELVTPPIPFNKASMPSTITRIAAYSSQPHPRHIHLPRRARQSPSATLSRLPFNPARNAAYVS